LQKGPLKDSNRPWWQKPGLGIMYQIEARPGWIWERDFDKFNASMKDEKGNLNFNGPFCEMKEWVYFSKSVGVDYHIFEAKWHDGICYFDTIYTNWKTPIDYCKIFAEESKKERIPFMFYYSSVFDHNPQFDKIQPVRSITSSYIALHREKKEEVIDFCLKFTQFIINQFIESLKKERSKKKNVKEEHIQKDILTLNLNDTPDFLNRRVEHLKTSLSDFVYDPAIYENYLRNQMIELIEKYEPDGMWMDWFMKSAFHEESTKLVMDLMKERYPNIILTFNNSINEQPDWAHYLSGEAHTIDSAWEQGNRYRSKKQSWELVGPAAKSWFDPSPRSDPLEIARIAVIIIANGGKFSFGLPSQMNGSLYPEPAQHVEQFGRWYRARHSLFTEATPMDYKGEHIPGIDLNGNTHGVIGSIYGTDKIIHLINFSGVKKSISLEFSWDYWNNLKKVTVEPNDITLKLNQNLKGIQIIVPQASIDPVDTILRITQ
jgi:alpha-L-fucosidase